MSKILGRPLLLASIITCSSISWATSTLTTSGVGGVSDSQLWELYVQIEQLQKEVQQLRGTVESLDHQINIIQQQQKGQYLDLDQRINQLQQQGVNVGSSTSDSGTVTVGSGNGANELVTNEERFQKEKERYQAANKLVQDRKLVEAAAAFTQLLQDFPNGAFEAFAHYWLGEVYMAMSEPEYGRAEEHFEIVLSKFPDHPKVSATLYKLGKLHHINGKNDKAKTLLNQAIEVDGDGRVSKLAQRYLQQIQ